MKLPVGLGLGLGLGLAAAGLAMSPGEALANGRYPAAGQIVVDPTRPTHIVVRTTYGLISTQDGKSWSQICDAAVGSTGQEDPMMAITKDGTVLAGLVEGLNVSHDGGCQWSFATGSLANRHVIDLATDPKNPSSAVLLVSNSSGTDEFLTQMWQTADDGLSWTEIGSDVPVEVLGLTCDTTASDPNRLYVSGLIGGPTYGGVLERSEDRGKTWTELPIPGSDDTNIPYIGAVDPKDAATVYVRLNGYTTDTVVLTKDGGKTWSTVFNASGSLLGFALSPDGGTIAIGGVTDGLWTAKTGSMAFTQVNKLEVQCLTWTAAGLYACAEEFVDGFAAGLSIDQGKTFTSLMHLTSPCGVLACPSCSSTAVSCPSQWPATEELIGGSCGHEGAGGAGGASAGSSGAPGPGSSSGGPAPGPGGCACGAGREGELGFASAVVVAATATALSRVRRARRRPPRG